MNMETWAQAVGFFAAFCGLWAMCQPSERTLKRISLLHRLCYIVHFLLLGLDLAVIANVIGFVRIWISLHSRSWFWVITLCAVSLAVAVFSKPASLVAVLPILASMVLTVTLFRLTGRPFRIGLILGSVLWVIHNVWAGSYGGVILESGMIVSTLWGWYRAEKEARQRRLDAEVSSAASPTPPRD